MRNFFLSTRINALIYGNNPLKRSDNMRINYANVGILEILLICVIIYSIILMCLSEYQFNKGRFYAFSSILVYSLLKTFFL